jgi:Uncharacterised methyltransferase family (DUF6094)
MARPESVALGGFYPTPPELLGPIASLFAPNADGGAPHVLDPCAGEGAALVAIAKRLGATAWGCEMERSRFEALKAAVRQELGWKSETHLLCADALRVGWDLGCCLGMAALYLNPPYDHDPDHGRLEERFLARWAGALTGGGVLALVVPHYALEASAATLARRFEQFRCYRFPGDHWAAYRQVVLVARKLSVDLGSPDPAERARVLGWAARPELLPELPDACPDPVEVPIATGFFGWRVLPLDVAALATKARPWSSRDRAGKLAPVPGVLPPGRVHDVLLRTYPSAMPPRPAHLAAGLAGGVFNGARLDPDRADAGLPSLLVKGVFRREYKTVDQKTDKDGNVKALVQVQAPELVVTALDLGTGRYVTLAKDAAPQARPESAEGLSVADLLEHYQGSLARVMRAQCPVAYDPARDASDVPLPDVARRPFAAQAHAARALVRLLGGPDARPAGPRGRQGWRASLARSRRGKAAFLLGEIGSGKTTVALVAAKAIGARKALALCPPHLLASWQNEVVSTLGTAGACRVLSTPADVDAFAAEAPASGVLLVGVLSREAAKLGHGWAAVTGACPGCGAALPKDVDLAKRRAHCEATRLVGRQPLARFVGRLAAALEPQRPSHPRIAEALPGRAAEVRRAAYGRRGAAPEGATIDASGAWVDALLDALVEAVAAASEEAAPPLEVALALCLLAFRTDDRVARCARALAKAGEPDDYGRGPRSFGLALLHLLAPGSDRQRDELEAIRPDVATRYGDTTSFDRCRAALSEGKAVASYERLRAPVAFVEGRFVAVEGDKRHAEGSCEAALSALAHLGVAAKLRHGEPCGEPLFQAVPEPRRVPLAKYICRRHPALFDVLLVDEGHEYATEGSAQEKSAHRLMGLGAPTILMSGSIMNGYAASLFTNLWACSPAFRAEFARDELSLFVTRYGYRKRLVEEKKDGKVVAFGSVTDRVERSERVIGEAPGVLPLLVLRHLLPISVTLHKTDLAIDLPPCEQRRVAVAPGPELLGHYKALESKLLAQIKRDRFTAKDGKLWGQLAELPSYLDRATADVGNAASGGDFEIRYPAGDDGPGELVARAPALRASAILPKEAWLLEEVGRQLARGRNVLVFGWHTNVLPRIAGLISSLILAPVPVLHADKVPTGKRQAWIDSEVVKKGRRVMVANPTTVQTGLNNLVHFSTEIWPENPACNPLIYRQAIGRIDRIGQRLPTEVLFPVYEGTLQEQLYDLLLRKVVVSVSTDGLDPDAALRAAGGAEDDASAGLSLGRQIYALLEGKRAPSVRTVATPAAGQLDLFGRAS